MSRTFYRIIDDAEPTAFGFLSNFAKGRPPRRSEIANPSEHRAISVFTNLATARYIQSRYPRMGRYVAVLELGDHEPSIAVAKADDDPLSSHYNLWGEPELFLQRVRTVLPPGE